MEINFICKRMPLEQLLKCSFSLSQSEIKVLKSMLGNKQEAGIAELQKKIGRDRTTVQRAVKTLADKDLVMRRQINLDNGGYYYVYSAITKTAIKEMLFANLDTFKNTVEKEIDAW